MRAFTCSDAVMSEPSSNWSPVTNMMKYKAANLYRITALLSLFAIFPHAAEASCVEKWFQNDGSPVKEQRCSKHPEGEWIYPSGKVSPGEQIYFIKGQDVYFINTTDEDSCSFSTGDGSGAASWLMSPWCWFGSHVKHIVMFEPVSSQGDHFHTLYQLYASRYHSAEVAALNFYAVDKDNVYHYANKIDGADPESFRLLLTESDLNGVNIGTKSIAIDKKGIYWDDKKISDDKWSEMAVVPVDISRQDADYREQPYFIKILSDRKGFYVFSDYGYALAKTTNNTYVGNISCYTGHYSRDFFCKEGKDIYQVTPDFSSHEVNMNLLKKEK